MKAKQQQTQQALPARLVHARQQSLARELPEQHAVEPKVPQHAPRPPRQRAPVPDARRRRVAGHLCLEQALRLLARRKGEGLVGDHGLVQRAVGLVGGGGLAAPVVLDGAVGAADEVGDARDAEAGRHFFALRSRYGGRRKRAARSAQRRKRNTRASPYSLSLSCTIKTPSSRAVFLGYEALQFATVWCGCSGLFPIDFQGERAGPVQDDDLRLFSLF